MNQTDETQTLPTHPATAPFWRRRSAMLIGGTLGAAALLVGGASLGAAMADDDDDRAEVARTTNRAAADDDISAPTTEAPAAAPEVGATDARELSAVLAAARDEARGTVTSMEATRDGSWSVDLENRRGDETTVRVAADGSASVVRTETADADDANDPAPAGTLSDANVAAIVEAALREAEGTVVDIDLDDDPREAYSVQVRAADGTETDVDLGVDLTVTRAEVDRD